MRTRPVPWAYRVLFRHLGLDPDVTRTPIEALVLERLMHGGFAPRGMPEDALALATLETGVPVWAVDADRVGHARAGDRRGRPARARRRAGPVAVLFGRRCRTARRPPHARAAALRGAGAGRRRPVRRGGRVDGGRGDAIQLTPRHDACLLAALGVLLHARCSRPPRRHRTASRPPLHTAR